MIEYQNIKHQKQISKNKHPKIKNGNQTSKTKKQKSKTHNQKLKTKHQTPNNKKQTTNTKHQPTKTKNPAEQLYQPTHLKRRAALLVEPHTLRVGGASRRAALFVTRVQANKTKTLRESSSASPPADSPKEKSPTFRRAAHPKSRRRFSPSRTFHNTGEAKTKLKSTR